jgi:hypothetical protein
MWATLVFAPFTAIQVIDLGITTIAGFQFFGVLFILRCVADSVWSDTGVVKVSRANKLAALFIFVCLASISMAVFKAGTVEVQIPYNKRWPEFFSNIVPLELSTYNFTQVIFPLFGVFLFHFFVREIQSVSGLKKAINILVWGALVVAGFHVASGVLFTLGQGTVYQNVLGLFSAGPIEIPVRLFRANTPAGEPGFSALALLVGIGLLVGSVVRRTEGSSPLIRMPWLKLSVLVFALLLNGSTTGYFGGGLLLAWTMVSSWYVGTKSVRSRARPVLYAVGGLVVVGVAGTMIQVSGMSLNEWIIEYHLAKVQGGVGSGQIRSQVTWYTLTEVFLASPILGVGYGSHLSLSLATFLLSNVGLVGFGIFVAFLFVVFRNAVRTARKAHMPLNRIAFTSLLVFIPFLGTLLVAKSTAGMNFGITWTVIALVEATHQVYRRRRSHQIAQA